VTPAVLRQATVADIAAMHRLRLSVRENWLVFSVISESHYREHLEKLGRGWVVEIEGEIIGSRLQMRPMGTCGRCSSILIMKDAATDGNCTT
jgi:hypothetical protein